MNISGFINGIDYLNGFQFKYSKPHSTFNTIFRKSSLDKANIQNMKMVNDASIYLRALTVGNAYILDEKIGVYRIHSSNISKSLDPDFIIRNIEEKNYVFNIVKNRLRFPSIWWFQQFRLTYNYFINSLPNKESKLKVLSWGQKHLNNSIELYIYIFIKKYL